MSGSSKKLYQLPVTWMMMSSVTSDYGISDAIYDIDMTCDVITYARNLVHTMGSQNGKSKMSSTNLSYNVSEGNQLTNKQRNKQTKERINKWPSQSMPIDFEVPRCHCIRKVKGHWACPIVIDCKEINASKRPKVTEHAQCRHANMYEFPIFCTIFSPKIQYTAR